MLLYISVHKCFIMCACKLKNTYFSWVAVFFRLSLKKLKYETKNTSLSILYDCIYRLDVNIGPSANNFMQKKVLKGKFSHLFSAQNASISSSQEYIHTDILT